MTMSAKDASGARPPPNKNAGDSALVRVVATSISTWLVPGASAAEGTGVRKPSELAQPASARATRPAKQALPASGDTSAVHSIIGGLLAATWGAAAKASPKRGWK